MIGVCRTRTGDGGPARKRARQVDVVAGVDLRTHRVANLIRICQSFDEPACRVSTCVQCDALGPGYIHDNGFEFVCFVCIPKVLQLVRISAVRTDKRMQMIALYDRLMTRDTPFTPPPEYVTTWLQRNEGRIRSHGGRVGAIDAPNPVHRPDAPSPVHRFAMQVGASTDEIAEVFHRNLSATVAMACFSIACKLADDNHTPPSLAHQIRWGGAGRGVGERGD